MTTELRSLGAAELTRIGGLKTRCSAALVCTEHNLPHPCEACEALGYKSVACSACLHEFPDGLVDTGERPCASQAVFAKTGRVAFEADAMTTLAAEAREQETARERRKREKEEAQRAQERQIRKEREERRRREAEEAERARKEAGERAREEAEREAERAGAEAARGNRRARVSAWVSFFVAAAGAYGLWQAPPIPLPSASTGILLAYAITVLLAWAAGLDTITGKDPAHATLRWWSPLAWAFVSYAWPGVAGLAVAYLAGVSGLGLLTYSVYILLGLGLIVTAVSCMAYGGVALTMRPPWPKGLMNKDFKTLGSGWVWLALLATLALNVTTWQGSGRLLEAIPRAERAPAIPTRKPLVERVASKPSPEKDMRGYTRAWLAEIADAVNDHPRLSAAAVKGVLPPLDAAEAALARLPRPPAGDRAQAKVLTTQAAKLVERNAEWTQIAEVLAQAHAADPQDAQILNDLAYAQMQTGRHAQALANIMESLRLAPTAPNGWNRLAQIRLVSANGDPRQIQEAARYYVVTYWFSRDRQRVLRYLKGELTAGPGDSPDNPAAVAIALQRLPK